MKTIKKTVKSAIKMTPKSKMPMKPMMAPKKQVVAKTKQVVAAKNVSKKMFNDDRTGSMTGAPSPKERAAMDKKPMTKKKK